MFGTMDSETLRFDLMNKRLTSDAPTHFPVAAGDCLFIADQLRFATNEISSSGPSQKQTSTINHT